MRSEVKVFMLNGNRRNLVTDFRRHSSPGHSELYLKKTCPLPSLEFKTRNRETSLKILMIGRFTRLVSKHLKNNNKLTRI